MRPFWEYLLLNVIKHPHAKFTPYKHKQKSYKETWQTERPFMKATY